MDIITEYNPEENETSIKSKTLKKIWNLTKEWFTEFTNIFNKDKHELLIANLVILITSIIISLLTTFYSDNVYNVVSKLINPLITYLSITIGFSLATLTFIIENLRKVKDNEKEEDNLLEKVLLLIVIYIIYSVAMIGLLILELIFGNMFQLNGRLYCLVNIFGITLYSMMIMFNLYIYCKIVVILYYFSLIILNNKK